MASFLLHGNRIGPEAIHDFLFVLIVRLDGTIGVGVLYCGQWCITADGLFKCSVVHLLVSPVAESRTDPLTLLMHSQRHAKVAATSSMASLT